MNIKQLLLLTLISALLPLASQAKPEDALGKGKGEPPAPARSDSGGKDPQPLLVADDEARQRRVEFDIDVDPLVQRVHLRRPGRRGRGQ